MITVRLPNGEEVDVPTDDPQAAAAAGRRYWSKASPDAAPGVPMAMDDGPPLESGSPGRAFAEANRPPPGPAGPRPGPLRDLAVGAQGMARAGADIAGMPVDIGALLMSLATAGVEKGINFAGGDVSLPRFENPIGGSKSIADASSEIAESAGVPLVDPTGLEGRDRLTYNVNRVGTQGALVGGGMMKQAQRATEAGKTLGPMLKPYDVVPTRALATDTAAGAGAGVGQTAAQEHAPGNAWMEFFASLLGGMGGGMGAQLARGPKAAVDTVRGAMPDPGVAPDPVTGVRPSRRVANIAAEQMQRGAADREAAASTLEASQRDYSAAGVGEAARPTAGLRSEDPGLIATERAQRLDRPTTSSGRPMAANDPLKPEAFIVRDKAVQEDAGARVRGLAPEDVPEGSRVAVDAARRQVDEQVDPAEARVAAARTDLGATRAQNEQRIADAGKDVDAADVETGTGVAAREGNLQAARGEESAVGEGVRGRYEGRADDASKRLDKAVVDDTLVPLREERNRRFDEIDPDNAVPADVDSVKETVARIRAAPRTVPEAEIVPEAWLRRLDDATAPDAPRLSFGELSAMRPHLANAETAARKRGDFSYADSLRTLRGEIDKQTDTLAKGAPQRQASQAAPTMRGNDLPPPSAAEAAAAREAFLATVHKDAQKELERGWLRGWAIAKAGGRPPESNKNPAGIWQGWKAGGGKSEPPAPPRPAAGGADAAQRARDALDFETGEFAPRFREGEGAALRRDINRDDMARGGTPPTATAGRFLKAGPGGEEAAKSMRAILKDQPSEAAGLDAAREYVMASLARTVKADGTIDANRLRNWIADRKGAIDQVPALRAEVDETLKNVVNRRDATTKLEVDLKAYVGQRSQHMADLKGKVRQIKADSKLSEAEKSAAVDAALKERRDIQREIDNSALSLLLDKDPPNAVKAVFGAGDPEKAMAEVVTKLGRDRDAVRAWKRNVSDHLDDLLTSSKDTVSLDKLDKTLKRYERTLAKVYEPEEMNALRVTHKQVRDLARAAQQGVPGSSTPEALTDLMRFTEIGVKLPGPIGFGALKGGSIMRSIKQVLPYIPGVNDYEKAAMLTRRAFFDGELALHLLRAPVKDRVSLGWRTKLSALLALDAAAVEDEPAEE